MSLSQREMVRLGELLDEAMTLTPEQRCVWLDSLPEKDQPLLQAVRESLMSDDPASAIGGVLDRMPRIEATGALDGGRIDRHAGERLGAYELLRPLGAGGMAEVWLANRADGAFERQVALKIPHLRNVPAEMTERFARECRILATLETPNIARLYDAGVDATGAPYIAMEYVQGEPLVAWCDARGLETPARIRLFMQVLDAVSYAHRRQVLHRDLKPSNILVTGAGRSAPAGFRRGAAAARGCGRVVTDAGLGQRADARLCEPGTAAWRASRPAQRHLFAGRSAARAAQQEFGRASSRPGRRTDRRAACCRALCAPW